MPHASLCTDNSQSGVSQQVADEAFFIKPRTRHLLDTGIVETDQPLQPFTGVDASGPSMTSAINFWFTHSHPEWHEHGQCRDMDQSIFYGDEDRTGKARHHPNLTVDEVARARRVCNACPVQMQCLEWSIVNREEFGIWGGSTAGQRKRWIKEYEATLSNVIALDDDEIEDDVFGGFYENDADEDTDQPLVG